MGFGFCVCVRRSTDRHRDGWRLLFLAGWSLICIDEHCCRRRRRRSDRLLIDEYSPIKMKSNREGEIEIDFPPLKPDLTVLAGTD